MNVYNGKVTNYLILALLFLIAVLALIIAVYFFEEKKKSGFEKLTEELKKNIENISAQTLAQTTKDFFSIANETLNSKRREDLKELENKNLK